MKQPNEEIKNESNDNSSDEFKFTEKGEPVEPVAKKGVLDYSAIGRENEDDYHATSHHHHSSSHHSSSHHRHHHHHHRHSKKTRIKRTIIAIICVILGLVVIAGATFAVLNQRGAKSLEAVDTSAMQVGQRVEYKGHTYEYNSNIVSVAFMGIDKEKLGTDNNTVGTAGQNDADIVAAIDKSTGKATLIYIPRETMVDIDVYSESGKFIQTKNEQLCLAYAYGDGKDTSCVNVITAMSRVLYGMPIEKYFSLDLNGISALNDAMGGVTVQSLYDFKDDGIKKGDTVHIKGSFAETYVRHRDLDSIYASMNRLDRQKQYLSAFASQLMPAVKNDFGTVNRLYKTAKNYCNTNLALGDVTYLASTAISKNITSFDTATLKGTMKEKKTKNSDVVNAAFYADKDATYKLVLDTFYTQID